MMLIFASFWYATRWLAAPILVVGAAGMDLGIPVLASPVTLSAIGNPQAVVAAAIVLGFRHPAAWGFVFLTKIGPGLGIVWFAVRREWRSLALALGATVVIAALSMVLSIGAWADFIGSLSGTTRRRRRCRCSRSLCWSGSRWLSRWSHGAL